MKKIENINYSPDENPQKILDLYLPENDVFDVFIYFHGGGIESGNKSHADAFCEYLTQRNIAVVSADYRMYPDAVYPEFIRDAAQAVGWVYKNIQSYGNCKRYFVGGSSAGGYLSMMLCFDKKYLTPYGIDPATIDGFIHDAGQPTCHFNVLRERGIDTRRVIIDESAPIFHIGTAPEYAPMLFIVSDNDMENRYEQTMLMLSTLKHFEYDQDKIKLKVMHGSHCRYVWEKDENQDSVLGKIVYEFQKQLTE